MQCSRLEETLWIRADKKSTEEDSRAEKIKRIKKLIKDEKYLTHEKLDAALEKLLEEIEHD